MGITIDGKPLEREPGERREKMAERWIQTTSSRIHEEISG